jgi:hypothetical protein
MPLVAAGSPAGDAAFYVGYSSPVAFKIGLK